MAVQTTDIKFYGSGSNNWGGAFNPTEIQNSFLHALFDPVRATDAIGGHTDYRLIYIKNDNATDPLNAPKIWISAQPTNPNVKFEIGIANAKFNQTEAAIATEISTPPSVTFIKPETVGAATLLFNANDIADQAGPTNEGVLTAQDYKGVWLKRVVTAGAAAMSTDQVTITVVGETA
jgi:hypothetical protein